MELQLSLFKRIPRFVGEVRQEIRRVVWPSIRETRMTTAIVFILAIISAFYFMVVDGIVYRIIKWIIQ